MNSASDGPAPPRRPGTPAPSSTRTPNDCSSTRSRRSSSPRTRPCGAGSSTAGVELLVVAPEHVVLELLRDAPHAVDLPVLGVEVRPRLVGAEEDTVAPDARALDLREHPAHAEADGPRRVRVHLVALLDPLEELRDELDVAGDSAAHVHEVDLAALAVALDERDEVVEVRAAPRAGVEVEDQVVLLAHVEALIGQCPGLVVPGARIRVAAEEERGLQCDD